MIKSITAATFAIALSTTLALAQSSQPQGGANQSPTSPTADSSKSMSAPMDSNNKMKKKMKMKKSKMMKGGMMKKDDGMMKSDGMKKM